MPLSIATGAELTAALTAAKVEVTQVSKLIRNLEDGNGYINYREIAKELLGSPNVNRPIDKTDHDYYAVSERNRAMRPYGTNPEPLRSAIIETDNSSGSAVGASMLRSRQPSGKRRFSRDVLMSSIRLEHAEGDGGAPAPAAATGGAVAGGASLPPLSPRPAVGASAMGNSAKPPRSPFACHANDEM